MRGGDGERSILILRQSSGGGGGADTVIAEQVRFLLGRWHENSGEERLRPLVVYLRKYGDSLEPIARRFKEIGAEFFELPGIRFFDPLQILRLARIIKKYGVVLVHCNDSKANFIGVFVKKLFPKIALVGTLHGWIVNRRRSVFYAYIGKKALKRFDAVVAVSEDLADGARDYGIDGVHVVKNGVDLDFWSPGPGDDERGGRDTPFRVGFVGRLSPEKGPDIFVSVANAVVNPDAATGSSEFVIAARASSAEPFSRIRGIGGPQSKSLEFYMAGTGPLEASIKILAEELNLGGCFHFQGHVERDNLRVLYGKLDALLLTSRTEGTPMAVLEAMAMGVPVVATKVGGVEGVITHGYDGLLADPEDVKGLAGAIITLKEDKILRARIAKNARKTVESRFSLQTSLTALEEIYMKTIAEMEAWKK
ncbi:MAG: glycosyltransferase family 4 protein [Nitrospirae bacterium]|nr:glycosyltransferase family 4 protein [Nitrospirota bacterium]